MKMTRMISSRARRARKVVSSIARVSLAEPVIVYSACVLLVGVVIVAIIYALVPSWRDDLLPGAFIEFIGMLFDVLIFGIIVAFFVRRLERRNDRQRQQEIIDDFKKWDTEEGKLRIAGAVRRMNRLGATKIDFSGITLSNFSFSDQDIENISGALFYAGDWGTGSRSEMRLEAVDFSFVDCRCVVFSKCNPLDVFGGTYVVALLKDCSFRYAKLVKAVFKGAHLEWTQEHPEDLWTWQDDADGLSHVQTHFPPFYNADLEGATFADANFKNADFRMAIGILDCDFTGAKGLENCLFDDEETKTAVLDKAKASKTVKAH
ncbi:pentapeptide repeat-containing protein [Rhizobium sp. TRM95111]|uniref:pentapeptide repeat-containing protein n=1 Tax=Rhizobium alarense TaxID=2846851 RepID=UPI001F3F7419|nr:pentapeptide repeat-containing protein [Rhizobium alarense]MCF3641870.1 pentapeptide repeat-containing protein [Rhizobium alarense]